VVSFNEKNKCICPFFPKEPTVTGDTFLAMMENTALRHVPVGTVFQSDVHPVTSPVMFVPFWTGSFLIVG